MSRRIDKTSAKREMTLDVAKGAGMSRGPTLWRAISRQCTGRFARADNGWDGWSRSSIVTGRRRGVSISDKGADATNTVEVTGRVGVGVNALQ